MNRNSHRRLLAVVLLILLSFCVRAISLDEQSLWRDEVDALRFAKAPLREMAANFARPGWNGPLYYLLLRGWVVVTGSSEYALRFLSLLFGVLATPLIFVFGKRRFGSPAAVFSAIMVATSPYLVWYSQEVKMYTLVLTLALLAIYGLRRAVEGGGWGWWIVQIAATSLALYAHILAALLIPVQGLLYLVWWPDSKKRWRGGLISLACLTLPYLPLAVWQAPMALRARETGFYPYSLDDMVVVLLNGWAGGVAVVTGPWATALMGVLAAGGLLSSGLLPALLPVSEDTQSRVASARDSLALLIWLTLPLMAVWLISLHQPLFTDRYLIWSTPAFYLLVALGLNSFATTRHWTRWVVVPLLVAILVSNGINLRQQATSPIKSDFRAAAAFIADYHLRARSDQPDRPSDGSSEPDQRPSSGTELRGFDDLVIFQIPYGKHTFNYYFPIKHYPRAEGLYTNHRSVTGAYAMSEEQAARQIRSMTTGYEAAWLVATEVSMWDERRLVQSWLDEHARRVAEAHFKRVDVYRYDLPEQ